MTIPAYADVPLHEPDCRGPMVTRAEHDRGDEYAPEVALICVACGVGVAGTPDQLEQAERARVAWEAYNA